MSVLSTSTINKLETAAKKVSEYAYNPYSKFAVGASVLTSSGNIYSGCNVENVSFGLTSCAERNAIFNAISNGEREIVALAIYTPTNNKITPCGACRQVIIEFNSKAEIFLFNNTNKVSSIMIDELLPNAFDSSDL